MGEYEKTYNRIIELKESKKIKLAQIEKIQDEIEEINHAIGECNGYINELEYLDGVNDSDEY
jgi:prefoldin subunit 5